jgi:four helix bundle protein
VYEKSCVLADELRGCVLAWDSLDKWTVGAQLIRAGDSIGANIAEACGRRTGPDRLRALFIARGSALELEHWISRVVARGLPCPGDALERAHELSRMLNGTINAWTQALKTED